MNTLYYSKEQRLTLKSQANFIYTEGHHLLGNSKDHQLINDVTIS